MTDMRRTLLWVVFSMSLFLIYDAWNRHNGQPSFFSPAPVKTAPAGPAPRAATPAVPGAVTAGTSAGATPVAAAASGAPVASERVTISTDLVKATLDSKGGTLVPRTPYTDVVIDLSLRASRKAKRTLVPV